MRRIALPFILLVAGINWGCGSSSTQTAAQAPTTDTPPTETVLSPPATTETIAERSTPRPVPHDGPLQADPAVYDCGSILDFSVCEFDTHLRNTADSELIIRRIAQDFSAYAQIGLVEDSTGFDRTMPYTTAPGEQLRLLFWYRRDHPEERIGGSILVRYRADGHDYCLEIPVGVIQ